MKKNTLLAIISVAILAAGATLCFPQLRLFFKYGTAAIIYRPPVIRENVTHIACIGDRITYGAGVADETGTRIDEYSWPYILEEKFGEQVQILNYGVCGRALIRESGVAYSDTDFYRLSQESGAEGYLIMLGTNDSKAEYWDADTYRTELKEFVQSYIDLPQQPHVVLITPPCAFAKEGSNTVAYDIRNDVIEGEIVPIVKETADQLGIQCFDLYAETQSHPEWFADGVHPNADGNRAIADFIHRSIMG